MKCRKVCQRAPVALPFMSQQPAGPLIPVEQQKVLADALQRLVQSQVSTLVEMSAGCDALEPKCR